MEILFLAANPTDVVRLALDEEVRSIEAAVRQTRFRDQFTLRSQWAVRVSDLQNLFLSSKPTIVHFSGHGSQASEIILQNDAGQAVIVPTQALSELFELAAKTVRCVLLNACFSERQAAAIGEHVEVVIGMSEAITDQAAIAFSTAFYQAVGHGQDLLTAFRLGTNQLSLYGIPEAHKPQILGRGNPSTIVLPSAPSGAGEKAVSKETWWDQIPAPSQSAGDVVAVNIGGSITGPAAIGTNIQQTVTQLLGEPRQEDGELIAREVFLVKQTLAAMKGIEPLLLQMGEFQVGLLASELVKAEKVAPSATAIVQVGNWLLTNLPQLTETLARFFALPAVGRVLGRAGEEAVLWVKTAFTP